MHFAFISTIPEGDHESELLTLFKRAPGLLSAEAQGNPAGIKTEGRGIKHCLLTEISALLVQIRSIPACHGDIVPYIPEGPIVGQQ